MNRVTLNQQVVLLMLGYPGAGKTFFARQFSDKANMALVSADRIRFELFEEPTYSREENDVVLRLCDFMLEEYLKNGMSVIYDAMLNSKAERRRKRNFISKYTKNALTVWVQTDKETARFRATNRDRRQTDDKYSDSITSEQFDRLRRELTRPDDENYVVISGKHVFTNQAHVVLLKMQNLQWVKDRSQPNFVNNKRSISGIGSRLIRE